MSCRRCHEGCSQCHCTCQPNTSCDCAVKIASECISTVTATFPCSGIATGQTLDETLTQLDQSICDRIEDIGGLTLLNVGEGKEIYAGDDVQGRKEIKSISGEDFVTTTNSTDTEIVIGIDAEAFGAYAEDNLDFVQSVTGDLVDNTDPKNPIVDTSSLATIPQAKAEVFIVPMSDLLTNLTVGDEKAYLPMPFDFTITSVTANVKTAQMAGSTLTIDVEYGMTSIFSTKLTIDNGESTSATAVVPAVIVNPTISEGVYLLFNIDQVGTPNAKGLVVTIKGQRA